MRDLADLFPLLRVVSTNCLLASVFQQLLSVFCLDVKVSMRPATLSWLEPDFLKPGSTERMLLLKMTWFKKIKWLFFNFFILYICMCTWVYAYVSCVCNSAGCAKETNANKLAKKHTEEWKHSQDFYYILAWMLTGSCTNPETFLDWVWTHLNS